MSLRINSRLSVFIVFVMSLLMVACAPQTAQRALPTVAVLPTSTNTPYPTQPPLPTIIPPAELVTNLQMSSSIADRDLGSANLNATANDVQPEPGTDATAAYVATMEMKNVQMIQTLTAVPALETQQASTPEPGAADVDTWQPVRYYTADPARVRRCAQIDDVECPVLVELPEAQMVIVTGQTEGETFRESTLWYRIDYRGEVAFVHSTLLTRTAPPPTVPAPTAAPQVVQQSSTVTMLHFYADWCPYCEQQRPVIDRLVQDLGSSLRVQFIDVDSASNAGLSRQYGVRSIPHTVLLNEAGNPVQTYYGYQSESTLRSGIAAAR